ncbi:hypothetical protein F4779DRAFT_572304 [Xylariaceae sp. FL0662B]|nr:hypothetical protein F4779DRAFT_572304 [Xylariaceae sp. FL0662B]
MFTPTLRGLLTRLSATRACSCAFPTSSVSAFQRIVPATSSSYFLPVLPVSSRAIHTTAPQHAKVGGKRKGKKKKGKGVKRDPRIYNLKASMPRKVPAPLRFARNRYLRHWTIHRAWLLYQRQEREREQHELERMYQSMHNACEELRKTSGPGTRDEGYLYRVAMEKKGHYGHDGIPIDYARPQTETPAREPWNHGWKR